MDAVAKKMQNFLPKSLRVFGEDADEAAGESGCHNAQQRRARRRDALVRGVSQSSIS
jgi:hypothetical protein